MRSSGLRIVITLLCGLFLWSCGGSGTTGGSGNTVTFLSPLMISPDGIFAGESNDVRFTITVQRNGTPTNGVVNLVKVAGSSETIIGTMTDDGDIANGDAVANDSVYSALVSFDENTPSLMNIKAKAGITESSSQTLAVLRRLTDDQWNTMSNVPTQALSHYATLGGSLAEKAASLADYVKTLGGVAYAAPSEDGVGVWIVYASGILGGIILNPDGTKGGQGSSPSELKVSKSGDEDAIRSKSALFLGPFVWYFDPNDDYDGAWVRILSSRCPKFDTREVANFIAGDQEVTPEDFKTLSQHGIIVISTHGDTWFNGLFTLWSDLFGDEADTAATLNPFTDDASQVIIDSGFKLTPDNRASYENDLQQHRLVIGVGGTLMITPQFIDRYNGTFPHSIVYLSSCRSMFNSSMSDVFLNKGASTVLGFTEYVKASYAKNVGDTTFDVTDGLLNLSPVPTSIEDAYDAAVAVHGAADTSTPPAEYEFQGSANTNLDAAALIDGGFERGDLSSWQFIGEGIVQESLGDVTAPEGNYMGCITTHFATSNDAGTIDVEVGGFSSVQQSMCIPAGMETLTFRYDVISEEPLCGPSPPFEEGDSLLVVFSDDEGNMLHLTSERTPSETWVPLGGDYFAGGDDYRTPGECRPEANSRDDGTYHTGWRTISVDVSSYAGSDIPLTLGLSTQDGGDLIYDTVMCLDDVHLSP